MRGSFLTEMLFVFLPCLRFFLSHKHPYSAFPHFNTDLDITPTTQLPRSNKLCPKCHETEAVFFQSQQRSAETGMKLFYVCCSCGTIFQ